MPVHIYTHFLFIRNTLFGFSLGVSYSQIQPKMFLIECFVTFSKTQPNVSCKKTTCTLRTLLKWKISYKGVDGNENFTL